MGGFRLTGYVDRLKNEQAVVGFWLGHGGVLERAPQLSPTQKKFSISELNSELGQNFWFAIDLSFIYDKSVHTVYIHTGVIYGYLES